MLWLLTKLNQALNTITVAIVTEQVMGATKLLTINLFLFRTEKSGV